MNNLNENVITLHGYPYVNASWSNLALMGHSAGGDTILRVAEYNRTLTNAIAFIEPFSLHFTKPFGYSLPTLSYGTQYSEENPKCIFPGYDSQHFYQMLQCPRILMNVTGFGHCDILDETPGWISK
jgi:chlorophyllase